ncbi:MAG: hypothetical protein ACOCP7_02435 [Desulfohalobiaceae bacterium]
MRSKWFELGQDKAWGLIRFRLVLGFVFCREKTILCQVVRQFQMSSLRQILLPLPITPRYNIPSEEESLAIGQTEAGLRKMEEIQQEKWYQD